MAASVAFDPSTAKPVQGAFDPSSAKPVKGGAFAPRTDYPMGPPRAQALSETIRGPANGQGQQQSFTAQQDIEKRLRAAGKSDAEIQSDPAWQAAAHNLNRSVMAGGTNTALGAIGGEMAWPLVGEGIASAAGKVLPGATQKAAGKLAALGPSLDKDQIGRSVLSSLRPDYDALHAERGKLLAQVAHDMEEGPDKTAAFRKIYQDPKFALMKKFEESPLGAKVVATTTRYSDVPKINPKTFLRQAFSSPQDVRDLKQLFNGDQTAVEKVATRYVASDLKGVMENARAASAGNANPLKSEAGAISTNLEKWRVKNADWLREVPETKKAVDAFIDNMVEVARAQKHLKYVAGAATALGLTTGGFHPLAWIGRALSE